MLLFPYFLHTQNRLNLQPEEISESAQLRCPLSQQATICLGASPTTSNLLISKFHYKTTKLNSFIDIWFALFFEKINRVDHEL